jgi:hypothetical protein
MTKLAKLDSTSFVTLTGNTKYLKKGYEFVLCFNVHAKGRARFNDVALSRTQAMELTKQLVEALSWKEYIK